MSEKGEKTSVPIIDRKLLSPEPESLEPELLPFDSEIPAFEHPNTEIVNENFVEKIIIPELESASDSMNNEIKNNENLDDFLLDELTGSDAELGDALEDELSEPDLELGNDFDDELLPNEIDLEDELSEIDAEFDDELLSQEEELEENLPELDVELDDVFEEEFAEPALELDDDFADALLPNEVDFEDELLESE